MSFNAFECRLVACCEWLPSVPHRPSWRLHYDFFARDRGGEASTRAVSGASGACSSGCSSGSAQRNSRKDFMYPAVHKYSQLFNVIAVSFACRRRSTNYADTGRVRDTIVPHTNYIPRFKYEWNYCRCSYENTAKNYSESLNKLTKSLSSLSIAAKIRLTANYSYSYGLFVKRAFQLASAKVSKTKALQNFRWAATTSVWIWTHNRRYISIQREDGRAWHRVDVARSHRPRSRALNTVLSELEGIPYVYGSATHRHKRSTLGNAAHIHLHYLVYGPLEPFVGLITVFITM